MTYATNPLLTPEEKHAMTRRKGWRTAQSVSKQIRYDPHLRPWMLTYAEWLTAQPSAPTITARRVAANKFAHIRLSTRALRILECRDDFLAYMDEIQRGPLERARAKYLRRLPEYIDSHWQALRQAKEAGDYKATAQISEGAVDRVVPKKQEAVAATQVNIVLSPAQIAGLQQYAPAEVEAEIVELEPTE